MKYLIRTLIILLAVVASNSVYAQALRTEEPVKIYQDVRLDSLMALHRKINEYNLAHDEHDGIDGYRVHLFFESGNNSKDRTMEVKNGFLRRFPDVGAYVIYRAPYYRLRVGDFRSKIEAEEFLRRILRYYPSAYVVKTKIKFPKLN